MDNENINKTYPQDNAYSQNNTYSQDNANVYS